jgi:hypothetical protein
MPERLTATERFFIAKYHAATLRGAVERAASAERSQLFTDRNECCRLPVAVDSIAGQKRITFVDYCESSSECPEARLVPHEFGFYVQLKPNVTPARRRFSLAHEIGHTLFYGDKGKGPRHQVGLVDVLEMMAEERICNAFARALMIPASYATESITPIPKADPLELLLRLGRAANRFKASLPELLVRISQLTLASSPYLILYLRHRENRFTCADVQLRVEGCYALGDFRRTLHVWRNRSASGINLESAQALFSQWNHSRECGRFFLNHRNKLTSSIEEGVEPRRETVEVGCLAEGKWKRSTVEMNAISCLYAPGTRGQAESYIISVLSPPL